MAKLYFLGGEDLAKRDSEEINKKAFADAGGAPIALVFIGWASKSVDESDKYRRIIVDYFKEIGARKIVFAELTDSVEAIDGKMKNADLVYLPGGDPILLVERIKKKGVEALLRRFGNVILGNSAGALALCKDYSIVRGEAHEETATASGVGLVDFCVDVHYDSSKDKKLIELSKNKRIFGIPERGALVCDENGISFIGDVYLFYRNKKTLCS